MVEKDTSFLKGAIIDKQEAINTINKCIIVLLSSQGYISLYFIIILEA